MNRLYRNIEKNSKTKGKVKIIGIGIGNSPFEVEFFKKTYNIPFPLFPDKDFTVHKKIGEVRTPYFIAIRINPDGSHRIVYSKLGGFKNEEAFLDLMVQRGGL